jgi:hypothetical protein
MADTAADVVVLGPSGQLVQLDEPLEALARALGDVRDMQHSLKAAKHALDGEVLRRMDQRARWTERVGGYELKGASPPKPGYEPERLWEGLLALMLDGAFARDALVAAVEPYVEYKLKPAGIKALLALDDRDVSDAIARARTVPPKARYVTVNPVGS